MNHQASEIFMQSNAIAWNQAEHASHCCIVQLLSTLLPRTSLLPLL